MGSMLNPDMNMKPEVSNRTGQMYATSRKLNKRVLQAKEIETPVKLELVGSLLYTRLFYNVGTWPTLKVQQRRTLSRCYMHPLRSVFDMHNKSSGEHTADAQVLERAKSPPLDSLLRFHRLRLVTRTLRHAPTIVIRLFLLLLKSEGSWPHTIVGDLKWLWQSRDTLYSSMPNPSVEISTWLDAIINNPKSWLRCFKTVLFLKSLPTCPNVRASQGAASIDEFHCSFCVRSFQSIQQLRSHQFKMHGYVNPLRLKILNSKCLHCNTEFHSKLRLFKHLTTNKQSFPCKLHYLQAVPSISRSLADDHVTTFRDDDQDGHL